MIYNIFSVVFTVLLFLLVLFISLIIAGQPDHPKYKQSTLTTLKFGLSALLRPLKDFSVIVLILIILYIIIEIVSNGIKTLSFWLF